MGDSTIYIVVGTLLITVLGVAFIFGSICFCFWSVERDEKEHEKGSKK